MHTFFTEKKLFRYKMSSKFESRPFSRFMNTYSKTIGIEDSHLSYVPKITPQCCADRCYVLQKSTRCFFEQTS